MDLDELNCQFRECATSSWRTIAQVFAALNNQLTIQALHQQLQGILQLSELNLQRQEIDNVIANSFRFAIEKVIYLPEFHHENIEIEDYLRFCLFAALDEIRAVDFMLLRDPLDREHPGGKDAPPSHLHHLHTSSWEAVRHCLGDSVLYEVFLWRVYARQSWAECVTIYNQARLPSEPNKMKGIRTPMCLYCKAWWQLLRCDEFVRAARLLAGR